MDDEKMVYPESRELFRNLLNQLLGGRSASRSDSNYTFRPYDGVVLFTSASAITATIPADTYALNYVLTGVQFGNGVVTFAAGAGVTFVSKDDPVVTAGQYTTVMAKQVSENVWLLSGMASGGGGGGATALIVTKTGDWLYEPMFLSVSPGMASSPGAWLSTIPAGSFLQNTGPTEVEFTNLVGVIGELDFAAIVPITSLSFPALEVIGTNLNISSMNNLTTLSFPALRIVGGNFGFDNCDALTSVEFPALEYLYGNFAFDTFPTLTSATMPALIQIIGNIFFGTASTAALEVFPLGPSVKTFIGDVTMNSCALPEAEVDRALVLLASLDGTNGTLSYDNRNIEITGTSEPPSATGLAAKVTLEGRGNTVTVNS